MSAALPKAPKGCHGAERRPLLEVPFSTSCAKSQNRQSPNKIRASFRFRRFYRGEEQPEICCPANWHAIGHPEAPKAYSRNSRPARKDAGNSSVSVSRPHLPRVAENLGKNFVNRERLFNVEGAKKMRTNHLKGESHLGLRPLVTKTLYYN